MHDYYRLLDIDERLDCAAIATHLQQLNRTTRLHTNHRDSTVREEALARLQQINEAFTVLTSEDERADYDRELAGHRAEEELTQPLADIDFYRLLHLDPAADAAQLEAALALAEADLGAAADGEGAARRRQLLALARRTLLDAERRQVYDEALQARRAYAADRRRAEVVPLHVNGETVQTWDEVEPVLSRHLDQGLAFLQDGELAAWLRWSLNQRRRAAWVEALAERAGESATPAMALEELLRLSNPDRPLYVYAQGTAPPTPPAFCLRQPADLPRVVDAHWAVCLDQLDYILDWLALHADRKLFAQYSAYPATDNSAIRLERLVALLDPTMEPPQLQVDETPDGRLDLGTLQAWESPRHSLTLRRTGRGYLYGTLATSAAWLELDKTAFAGATTTISLLVLPSKLEGNQGEATLTIQPLDGRVAPTTIRVQVARRTLLESVKHLWPWGKA